MPKRFGLYLTEWLTKNGMSEEQLIHQFVIINSGKYASLKIATISRWTRGTSLPSRDTIHDLSKIMGLSPEADVVEYKRFNQIIKQSRTIKKALQRQKLSELKKVMENNWSEMID
jgi:hypothetical protein